MTADLLLQELVDGVKRSPRSPAGDDEILARAPDDPFLLPESCRLNTVLRRQLRPTHVDSRNVPCKRWIPP